MHTSLPYVCVRNITDPGQKERGISHHVGKARVDSILALSTRKNLREFLAQNGGRFTQVHRDIEDTLRTQPELFSSYNAGVTICARAADGFSSKEGNLGLTDAALINGAQTQGIIDKVMADLEEVRQMEDEGEDYLEGAYEIPEAYVPFNLFVIEDREISADMTVALNNTNPVKLISVANAEGALRDLDKIFRAAGMKIRLRESDPWDGFEDTEKMLQVIEALTPWALWNVFWTRKNTVLTGSEHPVMSKNNAYSAKGRILKDFVELFEVTKDKEHPKRSEAKELYQYYLDISVDAWKLYLKWKSHQGFRISKARGSRSQKTTASGSNNRKPRPPVKKDDKRTTVLEVVDGFIFPCIATLSKFVIYKDGKWRLDTIPNWVDSLLIAEVLEYYKAARSLASSCGRVHACYVKLASALYNTSRAIEASKETP